MALFANLFKKKKVQEVVNATNPVDLLPVELREEFKASAIPLSQLENRDDWILLLNCLFFGSKKHDHKPLPALLQEYDEFKRHADTDSQMSFDDTGSYDSATSPVTRTASSRHRRSPDATRKSPALEKIREFEDDTNVHNTRELEALAARALAEERDTAPSRRTASSKKLTRESSVKETKKERASLSIPSPTKPTKLPSRSKSMTLVSPPSNVVTEQERLQQLLQEQSTLPVALVTSNAGPILLPASMVNPSHNIVVPTSPSKDRKDKDKRSRKRSASMLDNSTKIASKNSPKDTSVAHNNTLVVHNVVHNTHVAKDSSETRSSPKLLRISPSSSRKARKEKDHQHQQLIPPIPYEHQSSPTHDKILHGEDASTGPSSLPSPRSGGLHEASSSSPASAPTHPANVLAGAPETQSGYADEDTLESGDYVVLSPGITRVNQRKSVGFETSPPKHSPEPRRGISEVFKTVKQPKSVTDSPKDTSTGTSSRNVSPTASKKRHLSRQSSTATDDTTNSAVFSPSRRGKSPSVDVKDQSPEEDRGRTAVNSKRLSSSSRARSASPMAFQREATLLPELRPVRVPAVPLESIFTLEDATKHYKIIHKLGKGAFGNVYIAREKKEKNSKRFAVKKAPVDIKKRLLTICREIKNLSTSNHPNIVSYVHSFLYKNIAWIVMEYCDAGTIRDLRYTTELSEPHIAYIILNVVKGLSYLHSVGVMHRDIKGENILLGTNGNVKIADLGLATNAVEDQTRIAGSKYWMAPEMILAAGYGPKADIYSLGCVCYELAEALPPYAQYHAIRALFTSAKYGAPPLKDPKAWSSAFKSFIADCTHPNPRDRPSSVELLEHPFLKKTCTVEEFVQKIQDVFLYRATADWDLLTFFLWDFVLYKPSSRTYTTHSSLLAIQMLEKRFDRYKRDIHSFK